MALRGDVSGAVVDEEKPLSSRFAGRFMGAGDHTYLGDDMASMPEEIEVGIKVTVIDGLKLSLSAGDTLAVMVPNRLSAEQGAQLAAHLKAGLPDGVKVMVLDNGATVAAIKAE